MYHGLGHVPEGHPGYDIYGSPDILPGFRSLEHAADTSDYVRIHTLIPYETASVGKYWVTPLRSLHGTPNPFSYVISDGEKTILYLHDTGILPEASLSWLMDCGMRFDFVSFDCTGGNRDRLDYTSHLCFGDVLKYKGLFMEKGLIDGDTVLVLNHFSHNSPDVNYDDRGVYEAFGFIMSYDGMELTV
jgi:phosphoribosyl 1,2-cyclic phosphate phosphodiesterase